MDDMGIEKVDVLTLKGEQTKIIHPDSSRLGVFRDPRFSLVNKEFRKRTNGDAPPPRFIVASEGIVGDKSPQKNDQKNKSTPCSDAPCKECLPTFGLKSYIVNVGKCSLHGSYGKI